MADIDISVNTSELKKATEGIRSFADEIRNMNSATKRVAFDNFFNNAIKKGELGLLTKYLASNGLGGITPQLRNLISKNSPLLSKAFAVDSKGVYKNNSFYFAGIRREFKENLYATGFAKTPKPPKPPKPIRPPAPPKPPTPPKPPKTPKPETFYPPAVIPSAIVPWYPKIPKVPKVPRVPKTPKVPNNIPLLPGPIAPKPKVPQIDAGGSRLLPILGKLAVAGAVVVAAFNVLKNTIQSVADIIRTSFKNIEKAVGVAYQLRSSVSSSVRLGEMFQMAGMSVDKMKVNIYSMQQTLSRRPDYFRNIGIDVAAFKNKNSADQMIEVLEQLGKMKSAFQRSGATRLIFGFRSQEMGQLIERLSEFSERSEKATAPFKNIFDTFGTTINDVSSKTGTVLRMLENTMSTAIAGIAPRLNEIFDNILEKGDGFVSYGKKFAVILNDIFVSIKESFQSFIRLMTSPLVKGAFGILVFATETIVNALLVIADAIDFVLNVFGSLFTGSNKTWMDKNKYWTTSLESPLKAFKWTSAVFGVGSTDYEKRFEELTKSGKLSDANPAKNSLPVYEGEESEDGNRKIQTLAELLKSAYSNVGGYSSSLGFDAINGNLAHLTKIDTQIRIEQQTLGVLKEIEKKIEPPKQEEKIVNRVNEPSIQTRYTTFGPPTFIL